MQAIDDIKLTFGEKQNTSRLYRIISLSLCRGLKVTSTKGR